MVESLITNTEILNLEPSLADWYRSGQSDFNTLKSEAFQEMLIDLKDMKFDLRKLCKRLTLQSSVEKSVAFTGAKSEQDYVERLRWVLVLTSISASTVWTLQGTNDDSAETYTDITTLTKTAAGTHSALITDVYKYYRVNKAGTTTVTYSSYLLETTFENLHALKTIMFIYRSLIAQDGDVWQTKFDEYKALYKEALTNRRMFYDEDDDGEISSANFDEDMREVVFRT